MVLFFAELISLQVDKVDPGYFRVCKRINIEEETKIRATKEEADAFFAGESVDGTDDHVLTCASSDRPY